MKNIELLDLIWKPIKASIYNYACGGDYARYLRLKAKFIILFSKLGLYEKKHLNMLKTFVNKGDFAIDVGAHYGIYAEALSQIVESEGEVVAIEPLPEVFDVLKNRLIKLNNIKCINCAASDGTKTSLQLSVPNLAGGVPEPALASHQSNQASIYKVYDLPCIKLDELKPTSKLSFIKIDVEAHEAEVINGAKNLIDTYRPVIQVEISNSSLELASSSNPFGLRDYKVASLKNYQLVIIQTVKNEGVYYLLP